jgi:hypothetical protein
MGEDTPLWGRIPLYLKRWELPRLGAAIKKGEDREERREYRSNRELKRGKNREDI